MLPVDEYGEEEGDQDQTQHRDDVGDGVDVVRASVYGTAIAVCILSPRLLYHQFLFLK